MVCVALVGAHAAVAKSIVRCAGDRALPIEWLCATTPEQLEAGFVLLEPSLLEAADAFVVCFDHPVGRALLARPPDGRRVIDGVGLTPAAEVWPGAIGPLTLVVDALRALRPRRGSAVILESAARFDQAGLDALTEQTRAVFTMRDAPDSPVEALLAFNVSAPESEGSDAWTDRLHGTTRFPWQVTRLQVPTFSGELMVLELEVEEAMPTRNEVEALLSEGRTLRLRPGGLASRDGVDRDDVLVGQVQVDGERVRLVGVYDRLRRGSALQVLELLEGLV
ncbi:MAG: hypothetical protein ACFB9M_20370 [Myxococcota bacterium]